ncbi:MAG: hypothetical protein J3Q66DRAFT_369435 [Benniella sp.]|nr:MAG: hypothetical protein J3Q66DRAFT_369435 [Benniella sp.]
MVLVSFSLLPPLNLFKAVGLALLAALASTVHAYYYHIEITYQDLTVETAHFKLNPVDPQIPGNAEALIREATFKLVDGGGTGYEKYNYISVRFHLEQDLKLSKLVHGGGGTSIPCVQMDSFKLKEVSGATLTRDVSPSLSPNYNNPASVATTTCPVVTVTVPVVVTTTNPPWPTTTPPKPSPTCLAGYRGKKNGKGPNGACCSHSDDCKDTCVKGICRTTCLAGYKGKRNGKGPSGACCSHSDDCKDTCVNGACGVHP